MHLGQAPRKGRAIPAARAYWGGGQVPPHHLVCGAGEFNAEWARHGGRASSPPPVPSTSDSTPNISRPLIFEFVLIAETWERRLLQPKTRLGLP